jgi:hypothetical protein
MLNDWSVADSPPHVKRKQKALNLALAEVGISIIVVFALAAPVLMIWALVDLLRRPAVQWERSSDSRLMWVVVIVLVGIIGPLLYLTIGRRQLDGLAPMGPQPS